MTDQKIKDEMVKEFVNFYGKNINNDSTLINGIKDFIYKWEEGYEHVYSKQIESKATEGDFLIVLSGSGNSKNVINILL